MTFLQTFDIAAGCCALRVLNLEPPGVFHDFLSHRRYLLKVASLWGTQLILPPFILCHHILTYGIIGVITTVSIEK